MPARPVVAGLGRTQSKTRGARGHGRTECQIRTSIGGLSNRNLGDKKTQGPVLDPGFGVRLLSGIQLRS